MRKALLLFSLLFIKLSSSAHGETLEDALTKTLKNNMTVKAELCRSLVGRRDVVSSVVSGILPRVEYSLSMDKQGSSVNRRSISTITLTQPMFSGSAMLNLDKARFMHNVQDLSFALEKQKVLLSAIKAYMGVLSAHEVSRLNDNNVRVTQEHLTSAEKRFSVGEITKTELAKARARLSLAKSEAMSAMSRVKAAEVAYTRIVGDVPIDLKYPRRKLQMPTSLEEALHSAMNANLALQLSKNFYQASKRDVAAAVAQKFLPVLHVAATESFPSNNVGKSAHHLGVKLHWTIFEHGVGFINIDRTHKAKQQKLYSMHATAQEVEEAVINAWEALTTSKSVLQSAKDAVRYTEVALDAITQEASLNLKTTLDVLDVEQELLKAKVNLINAQSSLVMNQYNLLALIGQFHAG